MAGTVLSAVVITTILVSKKKAPSSFLVSGESWILKLLCLLSCCCFSFLLSQKHLPESCFAEPSAGNYTARYKICSLQAWRGPRKGEGRLVPFLIPSRSLWLCFASKDMRPEIQHQLRKGVRSKAPQVSCCEIL